MLLRQQVFERLNTGGVELENQEIRHCIYHNPFDELLVELSRHAAMRAAWKLPPYSVEEDNNPPDQLLTYSHYSKMRDIEFVLRFFALRHVEHYRGGMQNFLDYYMVRSRRFSAADIAELREIFNRTIDLAHQIYAENLFAPWNTKRNQWSGTPQVAFADSIMVGLSSSLEKSVQLLARRDEIVEATRQLVIASPRGTFTGQRNTKDAIRDRIGAYTAMLAPFVS